jgi:ribonuclease HII
MTVCEPDLKEERRLRREGHEWVAGLDEVGRGAWAGPLTVGVAVVRPRVQLRSMPAWLRDSKMLSEARREEIFGAVGRWLEAWSVGHATSYECDRWGMTEALRVAARRALAGLPQAPDALLIDGPVNLLRRPGQAAAADGAPPWPEPLDRMPLDPASPDTMAPDIMSTETASPETTWSDSISPEIMGSASVWPDSVFSDAVPSEPFPSTAVPPDPNRTGAIASAIWSDAGDQDAGPSAPASFGSDAFRGVIRPIVDGDAKCASVAAASVLAKVVRDRIMREEADHFPAYGFERNKGYPSLVHQTALRGYGPSAIHRRSWAFMEELPWRGHPCPVRMQISCVDDRQGRLFPAS